MSTENENEVTTKVVDVKNLRSMIIEITNAFERIAAEKSFVKDAIEAISDKHEVPKKYVRKLATTYWKNSFNDEVAEMDDFEQLYTSVMENK